MFTVQCALSNGPELTMSRVKFKRDATVFDLKSATHAKMANDLARVDEHRLTLVRIFKEVEKENEETEVVGGLKKAGLMSSAECLSRASYGKLPEDAVEPEPSHYDSIGACKTINGCCFKVRLSFSMTLVRPGLLCHSLLATKIALLSDGAALGSVNVVFVAEFTDCNAV
ncbi:hypothetical protein BJ741DRAFT_607222, partial [Chytriomyces cf. hyalinus JEL632]